MVKYPPPPHHHKKNLLLILSSKQMEEQNCTVSELSKLVGDTFIKQYKTHQMWHASLCDTNCRHLHPNKKKRMTCEYLTDVSISALCEATLTVCTVHKPCNAIFHIASCVGPHNGLTGAPHPCLEQQFCLLLAPALTWFFIKPVFILQL